MSLIPVSPDAKTIAPIARTPAPIPVPAGMTPVKGWFAARVKFGTFDGSNFIWPIVNWASPDGNVDRNGNELDFWRLDVQPSGGAGSAWYVFMETGWQGMDIHGGTMGAGPGAEHVFVGFWSSNGARCAIAMDGGNLSDNDSGGSGAGQTIIESIIDIGSDASSHSSDAWPNDGEILWIAMGNDILSDADGIAIMAIGETPPALGALPASAVYVWKPPKVAAITFDAGAASPISPDVVPQGLAPSTSLLPEVTLFPGGSRTGLLPVIPRSGGVLRPIFPDFG